MPEFVSNGVILHYIDEGQGEPFIFLHGLGGDTKQILTSFDQDPKIRLISLDMQGHGQSQVDWDNYNFSTLADDVINLMDMLKLDKVSIGGISMGAAVSVNLALRYPKKIKKLLLVRPAWTDKSMDSDKIRLFSLEAEYLKNNDRQGFVNTEEYMALKNKSLYSAGSFSGGFNTKASLEHYDKFKILPAQSPFTNVEELHNIEIPTLILACKRDWVHPYEYGEYYQQHIKNSILKELPDKDSDAKKHRELLNFYIKEFLNDGERF
ncbi:MAG: alpha/beta hydrolase [Eubacteriales bacterium]|nr:alpha/beta hydrolase [Eubacteriales bacterium]